MRSASGLVVVAATSVVLLAGCGGDSSSEPDTVNGCVIKPATSCPNADLLGADLEKADLTKADLSGANLTDANLKGADLTQANLGNAQIVNADLSDADLTGADLTDATIEGTNLDDAYLCGTTRTDGTTDDTSCPPSDGTTTETTDTTDTETTPNTTDTQPNEATVTSFMVGTADCSGDSEGTVEVTWETGEATAVDISVDGGAATGYAPDGTEEIAIHCDGASHEITITALNDSGAGQSQTESVSTG